MRRLLLHGTAVLILTFSAVGAHAITPNDQAALVAVNQQMPMTLNGAQSIEGGNSVLAKDSSEQASVVERQRAERDPRKDVVTLTGNFILLGIAALFFGLAAVGTKALWILDATESWPDVGRSRRTNH
jgi:hypothetical protein